jgi:peptidylprolyl isomerase
LQDHEQTTRVRAAPRGLLGRALLGGGAALLLAAQAPAPSAPTAPAAPAPAPLPADVVAQSGSISISVADVRRLMDQADPAARDQLRKDPAALAQAVRSEVLRRELLDEARAKKWDQSPDVAARAALARDSVIVNSYVASLTQPPADFPPDADVQQAYEANKNRFTIPRQYHMAQAFIPVPAAAPKAADDDALKKARDLRAQLAKPKADFDAVAKAAGMQTNDLGFLREDSLIPQVRDAVTKLSDGQLSDPVRAADGWHVFKLLATKPAEPAPLADVRENVVRALRQSKMQQNERALADDMQKRQPIQLNEIELARAVQP